LSHPQFQPGNQKFYGGPSFVNKLHMYRNYNFSAARSLVDAALTLPPLA
jgi:4-hydroxyphenylacetate 3-monooxygenase